MRETITSASRRADADCFAEVRDPAGGFATLATYTYDAFGRRIKKVAGEGTTLFFYDTEGHLILEVNKRPTADASRTYVYLEDELVGLVERQKEVGVTAWLPPVAGPIEIDPRLALWLVVGAAGLGVGLATRRASPGLATAGSGAALFLLCAGASPTPRVTWVHVDPLGTPIAVTNSLGTWDPANPAKVIWRASHEPFGQALLDEDPDGNGALFTLHVRFPGQYADAETGCHYNFYRTYDPGTGRYLEADPIGLRGGANLYGYANQDPLNFADPSGLEAVSEMFRLNWGLPKECDCYRIITIAQKTLGSERWALDVPNGDFGAGQNKCNLYVCDVISEALGWCPRRWGGMGGPISAGTWGDPDADIPGFPVVKTPQPGDVAAVPFPYSNASGHVGFVSAPRSTISAPGGPVTETGWPWDQNSSPQGTPVFRRCECE